MAARNDPALSATLTCPRCGQAHREAMPVDYCLVFFTCSQCGLTLRPLAGDCCVFCSFGDMPCPPKQAQRD